MKLRPISHIDAVISLSLKDKKRGRAELSSSGYLYILLRLLNKSKGKHLLAAFDTARNTMFRYKNRLFPFNTEDEVETLIFELKTPLLTG